MVRRLESGRGNICQMNHTARAVHHLQRLAQIGQIGLEGIDQSARELAFWPGGGPGVHGNDLVAVFQQVA